MNTLQNNTFSSFTGTLNNKSHHVWQLFKLFVQTHTILTSFMCDVLDIILLISQSHFDDPITMESYTICLNHDFIMPTHENFTSMFIYLEICFQIHSLFDF